MIYDYDLGYHLKRAVSLVKSYPKTVRYDISLN